ncbi:MAG: hypothetical protein V4501_02340 [Pseudomonadota bacterium]
MGPRKLQQKYQALKDDEPQIEPGYLADNEDGLITRVIDNLYKSTGHERPEKKVKTIPALVPPPAAPAVWTDPHILSGIPTAFMSTLYRTATGGVFSVSSHEIFNAGQRQQTINNTTPASTKPTTGLPPRHS